MAMAAAIAIFDSCVGVGGDDVGGEEVTEEVEEVGEGNGVKGDVEDSCCLI